MRSKNILIFLILLNAAAGFAAASGVAGDMSYQPTVGGDEQIEQANEAGQTVQSERSAVDSFIGGILEAADTFVQMLGVVVIGPQMLINIGAPPALVTFVAAPLYAIVGLDVLYIISNRSGLL